MLKKDLSHLPTPKADEGLPPDESVEFVTPLVEWLAEGIDTKLSLVYDPNKPQVSDTLTRHSSAGDCLKAIALRRDGAERRPMDDPGLHVTGIGTVLHELWQQALERRWPGRFTFEAPSTLDDLTSGSCDAFDAAESHILELKTSGGFSYKLAVGDRGAPQGPKGEHLIQLALNVVGHDAEKGTLVYLATEAISASAAIRAKVREVNRFGAQWTFTREQLQPLADEWLGYLAFVKDNPTKGVGRWIMGHMPRGARLNPSTGNWTLANADGEVKDTGAVWFGSKCKHYCDVAATCRQLHEGGV